MSIPMFQILNIMFVRIIILIIYTVAYVRILTFTYQQIPTFN